MIIVLKGADFSAKKIGVVVTPRDEMDNTTIGILSKYTKNITTEMQYAFDDLIIALKANGLWAKIVYAYFPCLANSVTESLYEAKGGIALSEAVNSASITTTGYQVDNYGLKTRGWVSGDGYSIVMPQYTYGINTNSFFIASLFKKEDTKSTYAGALIERAYVSINEGSFMLGGNSIGIKKRSTITADIGSYNVLIGNTRNPGNSESYIDILFNGISTYTYQKLGTTYSNPNITVKQPYIATSGYSQYNQNQWPVSVQLFGNELTTNEMVILNTLLQNFNAKIV